MYFRLMFKYPFRKFAHIYSHFFHFPAFFVFSVSSGAAMPLCSSLFAPASQAVADGCKNRSECSGIALARSGWRLPPPKKNASMSELPNRRAVSSCDIFVLSFVSGLARCHPSPACGVSSGLLCLSRLAELHPGLRCPPPGDCPPPELFGLLGLDVDFED